MLRRTGFVCLSLAVLAMTAATLPAQTVPKTADERKAVAEAAKQQREAKKQQAEQKRKDDEAERKAKAEFQKSIQPQEFEFTEQGFRYKSPQGWRAEPIQPGAGGAFSHKLLLVGLPVNPKDTGPREVPIHVIQVVKVPANTTLDLFTERYIASTSTSDQWTVDPATDTTLVGAPAKLVNMRTKAAPGAAPAEIIRQRSTLAIHNGRAYILQVAASTQLFGRASGGADQMVKSFEWIEPDATKQPAAATRPTEEPIVLSRPADRYEVTAPRGWQQLTESDVTATFVLPGDKSRGEKMASSIRIYRRSTRFNSTVDRELASWIKRMESLVAYEAPEPTTVGGVDALTATGKSKIADNEHLDRVVVFTRGTDAYAVHMSYNPANDAAMSDALAGITSSFKFIGDANDVPPAPVARGKAAATTTSPTLDADGDRPPVAGRSAPAGIGSAALAAKAAGLAGEPKLYRYDDLGIALSYPSGWARDEASEDATVLLRLVPPALSNSRIEGSFVLGLLEKKNAFVKDAKSWARLTSKMLGGINPTTMEQTLAGLPAHRVDADGKIDDVTVKSTVIVVEKGAWVVTITFSGSAAEFDAWLPYAESLLKTVEWK